MPAPSRPRRSLPLGRSTSTPTPASCTVSGRVGARTGTGQLLIDAHPSDPNELGYAVKGTFWLDDRAPLAFSGGVRAEVTYPGSVQPQTSPEYAPFDAVSSDGLWQLLGDAPAGSPPRFELILGA